MECFSKEKEFESSSEKIQSMINECENHEYPKEPLDEYMIEDEDSMCTSIKRTKNISIKNSYIGDNSYEKIF